MATHYIESRSRNNFLLCGGFASLIFGIGEIYYGLQAFSISTSGFGAFYAGFLSALFGINCFMPISNCMRSCGLILGYVIYYYIYIYMQCVINIHPDLDNIF